MLDSFQMHKLLRNTLNISGICDYLNIQDVLNLCHVLPGQYKDFYEINIKRIFVKNKVQQVKIIMHYCNSITSEISVGYENFDINNDDVYLFFKLYGRYIKVIKLFNDFDGAYLKFLKHFRLTRVNRRKKPTYNNYKEFIDDHLLYVVLRGFHFCHVRTQLISKQIKPTEVDESILKISLIDGICKYLKNDDKFRIFEAFYRSLLCHPNYAISFLQMHVNNYEWEFETITINYELGRTRVLTSNSQFEFKRKMFYEFCHLCASISKYVKHLKFIHEQLQNFEELMVFELKILLKQMTNLRTFEISSHKINVFKDEFSSLMHTNKIIFKTFDSITKLTDYQFFYNLMLPNVNTLNFDSINELDIANESADNMEANEFIEIFKLKRLERLKIFSRYSNLMDGTNLWGRLKHLKPQPTDRFIPKLRILSLQNRDINDRCSIVEFLHETTIFFAKNSRNEQIWNPKKQLYTVLDIQNFIFDNQTTKIKSLEQTMNVFFQPEVFSICDCVFEQDAGHYSILNLFPNISEIYINNIKEYIPHNLDGFKHKKLKKLSIWSCPKLDNITLINILVNTKQLKVIKPHLKIYM